MTLTAADVAQGIERRAFTLTSSLLGLNGLADELFTAEYFGAQWNVEVEGGDADPAADFLVMWGSAEVKGRRRPVEVHFLRSGENREQVGGLLVFARLQKEGASDDDWDPPEFRDLGVGAGLGALKSFGMTQPELMLSVDPEHGSPYALFGGAARYGNTAPRTVPDRFCAQPSSPGFSDLYARFARPYSSQDLPQLIGRLPIGLPDVHIPEDISHALEGLEVELSYVSIAINEYDRTVVGASIGVRVGARDQAGALGRPLEVIPGFFKANSLSLGLQLAGPSSFVFQAEFAGTLGSETQAQISGWYASGGNVRLLGAVRNVPLDPGLGQWIQGALGTDVSQILTASTVETMAVEANISPSSSLVSVDLEVKIPLQGDAGDAYFAVSASKVIRPSAGPYRVHSLLSFPLPSEKYPARRLQFTGDVSNEGGELSFTLAWEAGSERGDTEVLLSDLMRMVGSYGSDSEGIPEIGLSALKAVYRPRSNFLLIEADHPDVQVAIAVLE
ncbi:hypothetical protein AB8O64_35660 (plasmid) [Streptomyces sp. QH1-20]|uniref:hypothetical protein n=1 Tax=Streptomyces sp. QH1-20 TaxID=3240934 RepID=UPI00351364FA